MILHDLNQAAVLAFLLVLTLLLCRRILTTSQTSVAALPPPEGAGNGKTYRIRGVPITCDKVRLQSFMDTQNGYTNPVVWSLATEAHGRSQTATVTFRHGTKPPKTLRGSLQPGGEDQPLIIDDDFLGLTTLFAPTQEDHKGNIIAIPGLGGHAFGSFKERGGQHMWLRDALLYHILSEHTDHPIARVITYGYESAVANSNSIQNLEDLATYLKKAKPLILVAHSLVGLIVKQALITLASSTAEDQQKAARAIYGIVFFGVPHDGMDISSLILMVGDGTNRELIGTISQLNSQVLSMQQRDFRKALGAEGNTEIFCFYETEQSPTAQKDRHRGWRMDGPKAILVTKSSATHCRPWEDGPEQICAINRSHSNMVKFGSEDPEYERTLQRLQGLANRALGVQSRLWDENTKCM
ncbi:uncharacterized protein BCR38DRAFT_461232 [Pseudomassariella vexata]|uniref:Alpha/Beta hydrolase protein n=1 Tax=Pseudomassariella vexata TaxID=1141098 RepID=A0A1Y2DE11_9PEZI|nr:uncharacterized protein BCR38DRAFT_461232 [Pseudomassariella vexata]ORY57511.1 hypothetical protein BCR38DRAFT_461232 [Pseudomassariella vexata]